MGSAFYTRAGLERGSSETAFDWPEKWKIVGLDVTEQALLRLFDGDKPTDRVARAVLAGLHDKTRLTPPTEAELASFYDSEPAPIDFACIGPDNEGNMHNVVIDGRQRVMLRREWNKRGPKQDRAKMHGIAHFFRKEEGTTVRALKLKTQRNNNKPETLETRADRAADFREHGQPDEEIARQLTRGDVERALELIEWSKLFPLLCPEAVDMANDARLSFAQARRLAKLGHEAQREAMAPRERKAARATADHRPPSPKRLSAFREALATDDTVSEDARALARFVATGDAAELDEHPALSRAWVTAMGGGKGRGVR